LLSFRAFCVVEWCSSAHNQLRIETIEIQKRHTRETHVKVGDKVIEGLEERLRVRALGLAVVLRQGSPVLLQANHLREGILELLLGLAEEGAQQLLEPVSRRRIIELSLDLCQLSLELVEVGIGVGDALYFTRMPMVQPPQVRGQQRERERERVCVCV